MSERGDIWPSRGFSVTCILSAFIGALMVGMLLGEPDLITMLFGAVGGVMVSLSLPSSNSPIRKEERLTIDANTSRPAQSE